MGRVLRRKKMLVWGSLAFILLSAGIYLLLLILAPAYSLPSKPNTSWNVPVKEPEIHEDRLYIPRLSLTMSFKAGGEEVLDDSLWHRYPERGDPEKGGNFILAGHRFELAATPQETQRKSPLYHIDKIQLGDYLYADFNGKRYLYEVTRDYTVKPSQIEIEATSVSPKLTLYTCTLGGTTDGREVLEARLVKRDVLPSEKLEISASE